MVFQFNQVEDKYEIIHNDCLAGDFAFIDKGIVYNSPCQNVWASNNVARAIYSVFKKDVSVQHINKSLQNFVFNKLGEDDAIVILHTNKDKNYKYTVLVHGEKIGTIFKNRRHIIFDVLQNNIEVANAAYQLTQMYKQDIRINIFDKTCVITPKATYSQVCDLYKQGLLKNNVRV